MKPVKDFGDRADDNLIELRARVDKERAAPVQVVNGATEPVDHEAEIIEYVCGWEFGKSPGRQPLIKGVVNLNTTALDYGGSESGKTLIALNRMLHICMGWEWHGHEVTRSWCMGVIGEDEDGVQDRWLALLDFYGLDPLDVPFAIVKIPVDLCTGYHDTDQIIEVAKKLVDVFSRFGLPPGECVIDTLAQTIGGGDENSPKDMCGFIRNKKRIRLATGLVVRTVHHTGHGETGRARGHSSLRASVDSEFMVHSPRDGRIEVTCTKQRNMSKHPPMLFDIVSRSFTHPGTGLTYDVPIAVAAEASLEIPIAKPVPYQNPKRQIALETLSLAITSDGMELPEAANLPDVIAVQLNTWCEIALGAGFRDDAPLDDTDHGMTAKRNFKYHVDRLVAHEMVCHWKGFYWCRGRHTKIPTKPQ